MRGKYLVNTLADSEEHRAAVRLFTQLLAPRLDDGTARVSSLVDTMAEAKDQLFAVQHVKQLLTVSTYHH
jgi:conjugal transfer/entry exclusion protein